MKQMAAALVLALAIVGAARVAHAQAGKPVTIVDAQPRHREPNLGEASAHERGARRRRPSRSGRSKTVKDLDAALSSLTKEERTELYAKLFVADQPEHARPTRRSC